MLRALIRAGMDIARMNFSHCTHAEYRSRVRTIAKLAKQERRRVAILQDLQGPRIRVGNVPARGRTLKEGEEVLFSTASRASRGVITIDDPHIHLDVSAGHPFYLANGELELVVLSVEGSVIRTRVVCGGTLYPRKAVNLPHTMLTTSGLTEKDRRDVAAALAIGVDYIALSFVQSEKDVQALRELVDGKAKIIAKIESAVALKHLDRIIQASDGIMIARGDLGIELPLERIPAVQKDLIRHAAWHGKPSIVATQMLTSMIDHRHPTRAEVSDIANAVWEGADALMLSDETAAGAYPVEALAMLAKVARHAETHHFQRPNTL
jgi:pyruvate kinase